MESYPKLCADFLKMRRSMMWTCYMKSAHRIDREPRLSAHCNRQTANFRTSDPSMDTVPFCEKTRAIEFEPIQLELGFTST
jgi:hypothetical protein